MKAAIKQLEWSIRVDMEERHLGHWESNDPDRWVPPPHAEDRERIREYIRAIRVLQAEQARLEAPPFTLNDIKHAVATLKAQNPHDGELRLEVTRIRAALVPWARARTTGFGSHFDRAFAEAERLSESQEAWEAVVES